MERRTEQPAPRTEPPLRPVEQRAPLNESPLCPTEQPAPLNEPPLRPVERPTQQPAPLNESPLLRVAFGVAFELRGIDVPALAAEVSHPAAGTPPTRVRLVTGAEVAARWASARPRRARELRDHDGRVRLSVDADPLCGYLLRTPLDGRFLVSADGLEILCAPRARAGQAWSHLLVGQLLPLAATLRELEPLHASAVAIDGRALVFTAPPAGGKTSLALRLVLAGARLLADDVVAIEAAPERLLAHPGAGSLGVRREERARLDRRQLARLGRARRGRGKSTYRVRPVGGPVPLGALLLLRRLRSGEPRPAVRRLDPVDPRALLGATFNLSVRTPERLRRQLDMCARLAREVPVLALDAPPGVDAGALAACVQQWAQGMPL